MPIFKRGRVYWYNFWFDGKHIQESTKLTKPKLARNMEAAHRTALAKGEAGFREKKKISLSDFLKNDFLPFVESRFKEAKPRTLRYYEYGQRHFKNVISLI